ncbi:4a-hydroxytetrahydrobiopterin dehydratase [Croceivirga thetidis]|uniref:Putative pterin-4-alpha-carbinolamine dehydratase n=1 Tax=Croceivirga thetidis TaxID=2721623 RepID=A0ABX1GSF2_9FLAO|nr:4a-hydroxytetrahydrobiopterin dehydratase [Croceivirga thetidis]NKI31956.1 4a-hydroxytetrahydrobiopterin dehydratase [Croceivirga thetidis]
MERLNETEIKEALRILPDWSYEEGSITKIFNFKNFKQTFAFMTRVAFECELQGHHPDWENVYNRLTIRLNTHDAQGITKKDFDLAHTIENLFNS